MFNSIHLIDLRAVLIGRCSRVDSVLRSRFQTNSILRNGTHSSSYRVKLLANLVFFALALNLSACVEGDTGQIAQIVRAAELGVESIDLTKAHSDNLRAGRSIQVTAQANLESGSTEDLSDEVTWSVNDDSLLVHDGEGVFIAQANVDGTAIVIANFAGIQTETNVVVSSAPLERIEIAPTVFADVENLILGPCSELSLTAKGFYQGEEASRDESGFVDWQATNGSFRNRIFESINFSSASVDILGGVSTNVISANLDGINSNSIDLGYPDFNEGDASLSLNPPSETILTMGSQLSFSATWDDVRDVTELVTWSVEPVSSGNVQPSLNFAGSTLLSEVESDDVDIADSADYAGNVIASCSGLESSISQVIVQSDISDITLSSDGEDLAIDESITLTLTITDQGGNELQEDDIDRADDIVWEIVDNNSDNDAEDYVTLSTLTRLSRQLRVTRSSDIGSNFPFSIRVNYHGFEQVFDDFSIEDSDEEL